jgi:hypothetical protein
MAQLGTIKLQTDSGIVDLPVFDIGDSGGPVSEALRVQTDSGIGFIPLVDPADAASPQEAIRVQTDSGVKVVTDSASLIPDSAVLHLDAKALSGASGGDVVSTWPDQSGEGNDVTGEATFRSNGLNGEPSLEFDATNDGYQGPLTPSSQPNVILAAVEFFGQPTPTENRRIVRTGGNGAGRNNLEFQDGPAGWNQFAGSFVTGTTDTSVRLLTSIFDGGSSELRENGSATATGDPGSEALGNQVAIGKQLSKESDIWNGYIGEILILNQRDNTEITNQEQRMADRWGITLS